MRFNKREPSVNAAQVENSKTEKRPRIDKPRFERSSAPTLTYPCSMGKVHTVLTQWLRDGNIKLPKVEHLPSDEEKNNPKFCRFHRIVGHPTKDCFTLKRIFNEIVQNGEPVIGDNDVRNNPLPTHNAQHGAVNAITHDPVTTESIGMQPAEAHEDSEEIPKVETNGNDNVVSTLLETPNFKNFFDILGLMKTHGLQQRSHLYRSHKVTLVSMA